MLSCYHCQQVSLFFPFDCGYKAFPNLFFIKDWFLCLGFSKAYQIASCCLHPLKTLTSEASERRQMRNSFVRHFESCQFGHRIRKKRGCHSRDDALFYFLFFGLEQVTVFQTTGQRSQSWQLWGNDASSGCGIHCESLPASQPFVSAVDMYLTGDKMKISSIHLELEVFTLVNGTAGVHTDGQ